MELGRQKETKMECIYLGSDLEPKYMLPETDAFKIIWNKVEDLLRTNDSKKLAIISSSNNEQAESFYKSYFHGSEHKVISSNSNGQTKIFKLIAEQIVKEKNLLKYVFCQYLDY